MNPCLLLRGHPLRSVWHRSVLDVEDLPGSSTESPGKASQPEQAQSSSSQHTAGKPTSNHTPLLQLARDETEERRVEIEIGIEMAFPSNRFVFANLIKNSSSNNTRHQFTNNIKANLNRRTSIVVHLPLPKLNLSSPLEQPPPSQGYDCCEHGLHPPSFAWPHKGPFETFDHAAIRRGYQVYREVCSACHSLDRIAWRNLVGVSHTVDEVKGMAGEIEYEDGPDDEGKSL
ncbi:hypothetical protein KEM48_011014 [Puccinia striiformis f. sp. tritici PST-130]|nr:hypothetical protein KEM48_011014 [Puccinia striiformis f. sp. tritici PST-130]